MLLVYWSLPTHTPPTHSTHKHTPPTHTPHTHTPQVSSLDRSFAPPAVFENGTRYELQDPFWGPLLLKSLGLLHFAVSAVLIASYWYLKVSAIVGVASIPPRWLL